MSGSGCCGGTKENTNTNIVSSESGFVPTDEMPITLTPKAIEAVKQAIKEEGKPGDGIRVSVVGGGCAGYQYGLDFESSAREDDYTMEFDGVTVYIDPVSADFIKGTVIDFVSGLNGTGFKFNNPNAKRTCGCGSSFG